jgi:ABC-type transport system substrate-binding protein
VLLLLSGEADVIASVPTVMLKRLGRSSAVKVLRKTGYRTIYVGLNNALPPFNDRRVRERWRMRSTCRRCSAAC